MSNKVFIDNGYPSGYEFLEKFLSSPDFLSKTLYEINPLHRSFNKTQKASEIINLLKQGVLTKNEILLSYVKQTRNWLSFKKKSKTLSFPQFQDPLILLENFGDDGWYGPIKDPDSSRVWYIYILKISDFTHRGIQNNLTVDQRFIRWSVIAEVSQHYLSLIWNNFTYNDSVNINDENRHQFPFWIHIHNLFNDLSSELKVQLTDINLHELILIKMWDKYLSDKNYQWRHIRIRAFASGVALNAHSSGVQDININGLQALSTELAKSSLRAMGISIDNDRQNLHTVENFLLRTLIKEWGTKSYEFSLEREILVTDSSSGSDIIVEDESIINSNTRIVLKKLFKAHCYFGHSVSNPTYQDSLQHLNCSLPFGGSKQALEFLVELLEL